MNKLLNKTKINFITNFSSRIGLNVLTKLLSFVTVPLIARAFSPEIFGKWNLIQTIFTFILIPVDFGYTQYGIREIVQRENASSSIVNSIFSGRIVISIITFFSSILIVSLIYYPDYTTIFLIAIISLALFFYSINSDFFFIAKNKLLIPTINQFLGYSVYTILVVFFISDSNDLIYLVSFFVIYYIINSIINLTIFTFYHKLNIYLSITNARNLVRKTYKIGISSKIEMLSSSLPILVIAYFWGNFEVGIFSVSFKIYGIYLIGLQTLFLALSPYLSTIKVMKSLKRRSIVKKLLFIVIFISISATITFYLLGPNIINILFGEKYSASSDLLNYFIILMIPSSALAMLFNSFLLYSGFDKEYLQTTLYSVVSIILLIPIFTKFFFLEGTIIAMGISSFIYMCSGLYYAYKRVYSFENIIH